MKYGGLWLIREDRKSPNCHIVLQTLTPQLPRVLFANELIKICQSNSADTVGNGEQCLMWQHMQVFLIQQCCQPAVRSIHVIK